MAIKQSDVVSRALHPEARDLFRRCVSDFAVSLLLQAKTLAFRRHAEIVLSNDIQDALESITRERTQTWTRQLVIVLGGAFFGAFVQGFVTELSATGRTVLIVVYTALGFVGMLLVFWGLRR